ncbi:MAG: anti-sigma F factor [Eubacteriales bacterium]|nr:anti-sigma F factor [Eubacteriales bacterium]
MNNHVSLRFKAIPENEGFARSVIAAFCVSSDPTLDVINDIRTSVSEAVTNCIVHGYGAEKGDVLIEAMIYDDVLTVKIIDYGRGIVDVDTVLQDFYTTKAEEERSGLGFTIMKTFMDSLEVESVLGAGTTVTMTKKLANA